MLIFNHDSAQKKCEPRLASSPPTQPALHHLFCTRAPAIYYMALYFGWPLILANTFEMSVIVLQIQKMLMINKSKIQFPSYLRLPPGQGNST